MVNVEKLTNKKLAIELKPYCDQNHVKTISWLNSEDIKNTFGLTYHITVEQHDSWLKKNPNYLMWTINYKEVHVGNISLQINNRHHSANLQIYIGDNRFRGKRIGYHTMLLLLNELFTKSEINRIELCTLTDNKIAIALYKKIGFTFEGTHRQVIFKNNKYFDQYYWSILAEDWHDIRN